MHGFFRLQKLFVSGKTFVTYKQKSASVAARLLYQLTLYTEFHFLIAVFVRISSARLLLFSPFFPPQLLLLIFSEQ